MKTVTISAEFPEFKGADEVRTFRAKGAATEWTSAVSRALKQMKKQIKHKRFTTIKMVVSVSDSGPDSGENQDSPQNERTPEPPKTKAAAALAGIASETAKRCQCTHSLALHLHGPCQHVDPEDNERDCFCVGYKTF